ncbi:hypothetical protein SNEBB_008466 [Seison nebaliae]|nr:hypothetical protein SNEBB_008466 [Seison nebaliae]
MTFHASFVDSEDGSTCQLCSKVLKNQSLYNKKRHLNICKGKNEEMEIDKDFARKSMSDYKFPTTQIYDKLPNYVQQLIIKNALPLNTGEKFVRPLLNYIADHFFPSINQPLKYVPLSRRCMTRLLNKSMDTSVCTMGDDMRCMCMSIDDSISYQNKTNTTISLRYLDKDACIVEKFVGLIPISDAVSSFQRIESIINFLNEENIPFDKITSICTGNASIFYQKHSVIEKLRMYMNFIHYECFLYKLTLCVDENYMEMNLKRIWHIIRVLKGETNLSQQLFDYDEEEEVENNTEMSDILNEGWLAATEMLSRFLVKLKEIKDHIIDQHVFYNNDDNFNHLVNKYWIAQLYFINQILILFRETYLKIQGRNQIHFNIINSIIMLRTKLDIMINQLSTNDFTSFEQFSQFIRSEDIKIDESMMSIFINCLKHLKNNINHHFPDLDGMLKNIVINPFHIEIDPNMKSKVRGELFLLKNDQLQIQRFTTLIEKSTSFDYVINFWKSLPDERYWNLKLLFEKELCKSLTTWKCGAAFSLVDCIRKSGRQSLTERNLENVIKSNLNEDNPNENVMFDRNRDPNLFFNTLKSFLEK